MKRRPPTRRKPFFRQPPKRLPPMPPGQTPTEVAALPRRASNAVLDPIGTPDTPLPLRAAAAIQAEEGTLRADATVGRAAPHKVMLSWIEVHEALIAELPKQRRGIGDNVQPITKQDVQEITQAVAILKAQPVVPTAPDAAKAAGSTLQKIVGRLGTYLDTCLLEAAKSGGKELGKQLARAPYWLALWYTLTHIVQSVTAWLQ